MDIFEQVIEEIAEMNPVIENEGDYYDDDGLLHCGVCNRKKQHRLCFEDREKIVPCICDCDKARMEAEEEARKAQEKRTELESRINRYRHIGFPMSELRKCTFEKDDRANEQISDALMQYVNKFDEFKAQGKGLLLSGNVGNGKTFMAGCVANALIDKGYLVLMANFGRIIKTLQSSFSEQQDYIDSFNAYDLLIIDDFGVERSTEYVQEQVYDIIDSRYRAGLPLIVTTNLDVTEIANSENVQSKRVYDRVLERCHPIKIKGGSRRTEKARESFSEMNKLLGLE